MWSGSGFFLWLLPLALAAAAASAGVETTVSDTYSFLTREEGVVHVDISPSIGSAKIENGDVLFMGSRAGKATVTLFKSDASMSEFELTVHPSWNERSRELDKDSLRYQYRARSSKNSGTSSSHRARLDTNISEKTKVHFDLRADRNNRGDSSKKDFFYLEHDDALVAGKGSFSGRADIRSRLGSPSSYFGGFNGDRASFGVWSSAAKGEDGKKKGAWLGIKNGKGSQLALEGSPGPGGSADWSAFYDGRSPGGYLVLGKKSRGGDMLTQFSYSDRKSELLWNGVTWSSFSFDYSESKEAGKANETEYRMVSLLRKNSSSLGLSTFFKGETGEMTNSASVRLVPDEKNSFSLKYYRTENIQKKGGERATLGAEYGRRNLGGWMHSVGVGGVSLQGEAGSAVFTAKSSYRDGNRKASGGLFKPMDDSGKYSVFASLSDTIFDNWRVSCLKRFGEGFDLSELTVESPYLWVKAGEKTGASEDRWIEAGLTLRTKSLKNAAEIIKDRFNRYQALVYLDLDLDGEYDAGEEKTFVGSRVYLKESGIFDPVDSATVDSNGIFLFEGFAGRKNHTVEIEKGENIMQVGTFRFKDGGFDQVRFVESRELALRFDVPGVPEGRTSAKISLRCPGVPALNRIVANGRSSMVSVPAGASCLALVEAESGYMVASPRLKVKKGDREASFSAEPAKSGYLAKIKTQKGAAIPRSVVQNGKTLEVDEDGYLEMPLLEEVSSPGYSCSVDRFARPGDIVKIACQKRQK